MASEDPRLRLKVRISFDRSDGVWYADCLDLQGCHTFGETKEQALENIYEVIGDRLLAGVEHAKAETARRAPTRSATWATRTTTETVEISA